MIPFLCLTLLNGLGIDEAKVANDQKNMEGTWLVMEAELGGKKFPPDTLKTMKLVVQKSKYTVTADANTDEGTLELDATKNPKTMDIKGTKGPNQGKNIPAIYELKENTLKICYGLDGEKRPTEFKTGTNPKLFLVTYKREKP
jgi:uncharacterized protein (TIGR03067 family)